MPEETRGSCSAGPGVKLQAMSTLDVFLTSALAKLGATIVTYPLQLIKARQMSAGRHTHKDRQYSGTVNAILRIWKHEGGPTHPVFSSPWNSLYQICRLGILVGRPFPNLAPIRTEYARKLLIEDMCFCLLLRYRREEGAPCGGGGGLERVSCPIRLYVQLCLWMSALSPQ